jgi:hypothetical protein
VAFQIKDFASIAAGMLNWVRANTTKVTDFNVGSVVRTMLEATAAEMEELYLQYFIGLQEAIPVSVFNTFGFQALAANAASGVVRFTTSAPATSTITIPAGTVVRVPSNEISYSTQAAGFILTGQTYVDILVACQQAGVIGNCDAGTITELVTSIAGVSSASNPQPLINGRNVETDDERKVRFQGYISTLARGTKAAVAYGAKTAKLTDSLGIVTEYVAYAGVVEPWVSDSAQPISLLRVYIHNGASATSAPLVAEAQRVVDGYFGTDGVTPVAGSGWKAAGVKCIVSAASDLPVNVTGTIYVDSGFNAVAVKAACESAMRAYIQGLEVGADVILSELVAIAKRDVQGVFNIVLTVPSADVSVASNAKAISGTITLATA